MNEEDIEYQTTGKYTKLCITANTLVSRGAVMEQAVFKENGKVIKTIKHIEKIGDEKKLQMHSICYMLNKKDSHGNYCDDPKVLEDACGDWMLNGSKIIKHTHEGKEIDAYVQQLYIVPAGHPLWKEDKYIGSIANVIQFKDVELYKYYRDNDFETSIEGYAEEEIVQAEKTNLFKKLYKIITNQLKLEGILPMDKDVKKAEEIVDETVKVEEVKVEEPVKKEIDPMIVEYVTSIVNELISKYDAKYDELKAMIENKPEAESEDVIELKKELKELKKEIGKTSQVDSVPAVKKAKTLLS
jgi:hypothetical protein